MALKDFKIRNGIIAGSDSIINGNLTVISTTETLRLGYDDTHYTSFISAADGTLSLNNKLTLAGGSTSIAGGLKLTASAVKSTPSAGDSGSIEYDGTDLHFIDSTGNRKTLGASESSSSSQIAKIIALSW